MASNYTEFKVGSIIYLRSYNSLVAKWDNENHILTLGKDWDYSVTTVKHVGTFMDYTHMFKVRGAKAIQKAINEGLITYDPDMK